MKVELNPCFILHRRNYRETSLLLEVFSSEYGRVNLIAKGVKGKKKDNKQGLLQVFQKLLLSWSGKGELGTLNNIEALPQANNLTGEAIISGFYLNELIIRLLHKNESHIELFKIYEESLNDLNTKHETQIILRKFEKALLEVLGYGLVLDHDVESNQILQADKSYYYCLEFGPTETLPKSGSYIHLSGQTLLDIDKDEFVTEKSKREAKKLMRSLLAHILGPKPLASRELFQSYLNSN